MATDIKKRRQRWKMSKEVELFVDDLIARGYAAGSVYNYRNSVEKFFSLFDDVTVENASAYREMLADEYPYRTAHNKVTAFNRYCDFINKPECRIKTMFGDRKRDDLQRLTNSNTAGASTSSI